MKPFYLLFRAGTLLTSAALMLTVTITDRMTVSTASTAPFAHSSLGKQSPRMPFSTVLFNEIHSKSKTDGGDTIATLFYAINGTPNATVLVNLGRVASTMEGVKFQSTLLNTTNVRLNAAGNARYNIAAQQPQSNPLHNSGDSLIFTYELEFTSQ